MKKLNIMKSFKERRFRYGGYATILTAVVLAILIIVNLVAGNLNWRIDLTKNQLFSLSDQTYKLLDSLKQDITITIFDESGKENPVTISIMDKYAARTKKVAIEYKDPVKYPALAQKYSTDGNPIAQGSIVVSSGSKFKLVNSYDLVNYSTDASGQPIPDTLAVEQRITSAIIFITSTDNPILYNLTGHEEDPLPAQVLTQLGNENYTVKDLNLLVKSATLTPGSTLFVLSPKRDATNDEASQIKTFLSKGGKAVFLMDYLNIDLPNFQSIFNSYGINVKKSVVVEGDASYSAGNNPIFLVPDMTSHPIVDPLMSKNLAVLIPIAQAIEINDLKKSSLTIDPLLKTSKDSWAKVNPESKNIEKEPGDLTGPFNVAVAISDRIDMDNEARMVVVSNGLFIDPEYVPNGGNIDFMMNSVNWVANRQDAISIRAKSLEAGTLSMNDLERYALSGVVVIVIPVVIAIYGVIVWLRRKRQ